MAGEVRTLVDRRTGCAVDPFDDSEMRALVDAMSLTDAQRRMLFPAFCVRLVVKAEAGEEMEKFRARLRSYVDGNHVFGVHNGDLFVANPMGACHRVGPRAVP